MQEMNWLEIAKYNCIMGHEFAEAYACDKMTPEQRKEYGEWRNEYTKQALKDCPF